MIGAQGASPIPVFNASLDLSVGIAVDGGILLAAAVLGIVGAATKKRVLLTIVCPFVCEWTFNVGGRVFLRNLVGSFHTLDLAHRNFQSFRSACIQIEPI